MTHGDRKKSLWAGSPEHHEADDASGVAAGETTAPVPRSAARQESLWASPRAYEPEELDDVVVRWELDEPDAPAPPASPRQRVRVRELALGVLAVVVFVALAIAQPGADLFTVQDVPSYWHDVPMTCHTGRMEQGDERALEFFRCRAEGGGTLPPGIYRSPDSWWRSDITQRRARENEMRISTDGELTGWAAY